MNYKMNPKDEFKDINFRSEELEREYIGVTFDHCDFTESMPTSLLLAAISSTPTIIA